MKPKNKPFHALMGAIALTASLGSGQAQLVSSWTAPSTDDGNPIPNFRNTWNTDVTTGKSTALPILTGQALAADNTLDRLYSSSGNALTTFARDENGVLVTLAQAVGIKDAKGVKAGSNQVQSLGFANGVLYASLSKGGRSNLAEGLYAINPSTAVATLLKRSTDLGYPFFSGMDYNPADSIMYAIAGSPQKIVRFDLTSFAVTTVADVPASAYNGVTGVSFAGLAAGDGKLFLTHGLNPSYGTVPIAVFDLASGTFLPGLPSPSRSAENRSYGAGATYFPAASGVDLNPGPPSPPRDLAARGVLEGQVLLTWATSPESDFAAYHIFRSTDGVEFQEIGMTTSPTFTDTQVGGAGVAYRYFVTASDKSGLESAPSATAIYITPGGAAPFIAVSAIDPTILTDSSGRNRGRARVTILDQLGLPVPSAIVTVKFTGSFNESVVGVTDTKGVATITTLNRISGPVAFEACVTDVSAGNRTYDPAKNAENCDSFSSF